MTTTTKLLHLSTFLLLLYSCEGFVPGLNDGGDLNSSDPEKVSLYISIAQNLEQSNALLQQSSGQMLAQMEEKVTEKPTWKPIADYCISVQTQYNSSLALVEELCEQLIVETVGSNSNTNSKSIPKAVLFESGKIAELQNFIKNTQPSVWEELDDLIQYAEEGQLRNIKFNPKDIEKLKADFPLRSVENDTWIKDNFEGQTVGAVYAQLRQLQSDINASLIQLIQLLKNSERSVLLYDKFIVTSNSQKPYILLGESYESEIQLGGYSSQADFTATVNGEPLKIEDGLALYTHKPGSVGTQSYTVRIAITNPLTGEVTNVAKEFKYEVGGASATAILDKMNVLYVGVDNPISIAAAGVASNNLQVTVSGAGNAHITRTATGKYRINPTSTTTNGQDCNIEIKDKKSGKKLGSFPFRVKRIPDPSARLTNNKTDGSFPAAEMRIQRGLMAVLENFDFDARCEIQGFTMYFTPPRQDAIEITNAGAVFSGQTIQAIQAAKPGTTYQFVDVKGRCPGDMAGRKLNSLAFIVR
jgi:gliding motility-associated protein GldM